MVGRAYDTSAAKTPLRGLVVRASDKLEGTTKADGTFTLLGVAPGRLTISTEHPMRSSGLRRVTITKGRAAYVDFALSEAISTTFDPKEGGGIRRADGAGAQFERGSLTRADGRAPSGRARITLAALDPTDPYELEAIPGELTGSKSGRPGLLRAYAPVEVRLTDGSGQRLQLAAGRKATLSFPVSANLPDPPAEVDMWSLNEQTGDWVHEGRARQMLDEAGARIYRGEISHLSWWSCSEFVEDVTCVRGCVRDEKGSRARGATVNLVDPAGRFRVNASIGDDGCFQVNVQQNTEYTLSAAFAGKTSAPRTVRSGDAPGTWETDPSGCTNLGNITLAPEPSDSTCPEGQTSCDGECYDVQYDSDQCGFSCLSAVSCGDEASCVDGACVCPSGAEACKGRCTDIRSDPSLCGTNCEATVTCPPGVACVDGACQAGGAIQCGAQVCTPHDNGLISLAPCCADGEAGGETCGLRTDNLPLGIAGTCAPLRAPGVASPSCAQALGGVGSDRIGQPGGPTFPGCCTAHGLCSADTSAGSLSGIGFDLGLGCAAPERLFPGGTQVRCDPLTGAVIAPSPGVGGGIDASVDAGPHVGDAGVLR